MLVLRRIRLAVRRVDGGLDVVVGGEVLLGLDDINNNKALGRRQNLF